MTELINTQDLAKRLAEIKVQEVCTLAYFKMWESEGIFTMFAQQAYNEYYPAYLQTINEFKAKTNEN